MTDQCKILRFYCNSCGTKRRAQLWIGQLVGELLILSEGSLPSTLIPPTCSMGWNIVCMKPRDHLVTPNKWQMLDWGWTERGANKQKTNKKKKKRILIRTTHNEIQQLVHGKAHDAQVIWKALFSRVAYPGRCRWSHVFLFLVLNAQEKKKNNARFAVDLSAHRSQKKIY